MEEARVVMVTIDTGAAPSVGARMSLDEDRDLDGNPRAVGAVPDPEGAWVVASVGEPDVDRLVSVFLHNPSRPDSSD